MARSIHVTLAAAVLSAVSFLPHPQAQSTATPPASPILAPTAEKLNSAPAPKRSRAISGDVAAALAAAAPKYTPPPPKPEPKPEEEQVDLREVDKPKNTIVRLPKYIVQEAKPAIFTERSIHTQKGLTDIAMRRYISDADRALNRFTLPLFGISAEARALAMYAEDERLKNMSDLNEAARITNLTDTEAGTYIRKESQKTYLRSSDYGWNGGGPK